ncbi:MAG: TolC family protein, partial [Moraxellaceae bacterium]
FPLAAFSFFAKPGISASSLWPNSTDQQVQTNLAENLIEKSQRLKVLEAQAKVEQLQIQAKPLPTVNVGVNQIKSPQTQIDHQIVVGVSTPLNLFNRQKYSIEMVKAKENLLNEQQLFYARQNALHVETLLTELQGLESQFNEVEQVQLPLALQVQHKTLLGFNAGKFEVVNVQQATLQLQEIRLRKVQLLREAWQVAIEAESLSLGIEPSEVIAKNALAQINQNLWQDIQALPVIGGEN